MLYLAYKVGRIEFMVYAGKKKRNILIVLGIFVVLLLIFLAIFGTSKKYEVIFDTDGGSSISSILVKKNEKISPPEDPTKAGYKFDGWYLDDNEFDFNTRITKDIILKAHWLLEDNILRLDLTELSLKLGSKHTFNVENTTKQSLKWSSSDESVATVDATGTVTALKNGQTTITVTTKDGKFKASSIVTVTDEIVSVTGASISGSSSVTVGKTIKLKAYVEPTNASNKAVTWESSDEEIAYVDKFGNVKGLKAGKVEITVTTKDGNFSSTKTITVKEKKNKTEAKDEDKDTGEDEEKTNKNISVESVKISGEKTVNVKENLQLTAVIYPSNATNKKVTWTSNDKSIATVDNNGLVTGVKAGEVTILVTTDDGKHTDSINITVKTTYAIEFTKKYNNYNVPVGYDLVVYKNKEKWHGFTSIIYNDNTKKFAASFAAIAEIDENVKTASIKIDDEIIDNVPVSYQ